MRHSACDSFALVGAVEESARSICNGQTPQALLGTEITVPSAVAHETHLLWEAFSKAPLCASGQIMMFVLNIFFNKLYMEASVNFKIHVQLFKWAQFFQSM